MCESAWRAEQSGQLDDTAQSIEQVFEQILTYMNKVLRRIFDLILEHLYPILQLTKRPEGLTIMKDFEFPSERRNRKNARKAVLCLTFTVVLASLCLMAFSYPSAAPTQAAIFTLMVIAPSAVGGLFFASQIK